MADRPNILCLVSEDCPPRLGAYGDEVARTPNLDALARKGTTWEVACCTAPVCAPSRFSILLGRHAPSVPPAQHMSTVARLPQGLITYPEMMRAAGYYCTNNAKTHYNCDVNPSAIWHESSERAHWSNRPDASPFLAVFNCMVTHESCVFGQQAGPVEEHHVAIPPYLPDTQGMRRSLATYYNRIEQMDRFMGERLLELEEAGLSEETIVFYYSDHGSPLPRSKRFCYDEGLRVPLIVHVPEKWRHLLPLAPGSRINSPVSLVDLFPTFAALANAEPPPGLHGQAFLGPARRERTYVFSGRDRMDEHYDMVRTVRSNRFRYIRNYAPHRKWGQHYAFAWESPAFRDFEAAHLAGRLNATQERFWNTKPAEELYDAEADPHSTLNLATDPGYAGTLLEMRAALDEHMLHVRDGGFVPEGDRTEEWEAFCNEVLFPIARVMDIAWRAIQRDPSEANGFVALLSDESPVVRYWAAQGLLMLSVAGSALPDGIVAALAKEANRHIRIPLMEALGHAGDARSQVRALTRLVEVERNSRLRLQALDALCALPAFPEISLQLMRDLSDNEEEYLRGAAGYMKLKMEGGYTPDARIFRFDLFRAGVQQSRAG